MKKLTSLLLCLAVLGSADIAQAESKSVTDLPDISVIGNMVATSTEDDGANFDVRELEFSFQHYLYPDVKADVFVALHKEDGERKVELEEAYVTFADLFGTLMPNSNKNLGVGAVVGRKLLGIGKLNAKHPEQWNFVDRPLAHQTFLGGTEGLGAEGAQVSYLVPTSFFSQLELGYWIAGAHTEEEEDAHSHGGVEYENKLMSARLWNGFELSNSQELELGFSYLLGNASSSEEADQQGLVGTDISYTQDLGSDQSATLEAEYYQAIYGEEGEERAEQEGYAISGLYKMNPYYQVGLRYGHLSAHGDEGENKHQWAWMITRQLTETSKFRVQYNTGEGVEDTITAQFIFGMGPHSHVLQ